MKKTTKLILLTSLCAVIALSAVIAVACKPKQYQTVVASQQTLGNGGYGAVFNAQIDPFNPNYFAASCDMGSVYFSFDTGTSWMRHNLKGTVYCVKYDPSAEGAVWVSGSGVYKSTDHGKTLKLVFPKPEQITSQGNNYENANYWIYTDKQSDYAPHYQIWSIAINRKSNGQNVFVAQRVPAAGLGYSQSIRIYQTTDGENFSLFKEMEYSYNYKIDYDEANDCLVYVTPQKIVEINKQGEIVATINQPVHVQFSHGNNMAFDSYYDKQTGKNTFVFSEPTEQEHLATVCYKTNNLRDKTTYQNLSQPLLSLTADDFGLDSVEKYNQGRPSYEYCEWINGKTVPQQFKWTISDMSVLNDDVVYLFHQAQTDTFDSNGNFYINRRTLIYLKYDARKPEGQQYTWVFGNPHRVYNKFIQNTAWVDSDSSYNFGMTSSPQNEDALLYCSNVGIYYTSDGKKVTQLNSKVFGSVELTMTDKDGTTQTKSLQKVTTTGIDVICTQSVATDPFNKNHLLMCCTDIGMLQSYDEGETWYHSLNEWKGGSLTNIAYQQYTNTCFEAHFDTEKQNVVYGLWSTAKTAPYAPDASYLTSPARFGISYDGGLSWTMKKITSDGNCLPYKMHVDYQNNGKRKIYITTFSHGFFVTDDLGETFQTMNDGLPTSKVGNLTAIWANKLLICEEGTYAIIGGAATDPTSQGFYKWDQSSNKFVALDMPTSQYNNKVCTPAAIRDIVYDKANQCLYLACTATSATNYSSLVKKAGGIWKYKDGQYTQIYDETISVFGLNLDSSGRLYATELDGRLIRFDDNNTTYQVLLDNLFHRLKGICFGSTDNILYLPTWGGSTEKVILEQRPI